MIRAQVTASLTLTLPLALKKNYEVISEGDQLLADHLRSQVVSGTPLLV